MTAHRRQLAALLAMAAASTMVLAGAGCRGDRTDERPRRFFPSLDSQPKYLPQESSEFFADGRAMREPVGGTVAFGRSVDPADAERDGFLRTNDAVYRGVDEEGNYLEWMPVRNVLGVAEGDAIPADAMRRLIERGRDRYNVFCMVCHGATGEGDGMVGSQWSYALPSFHDATYQRGGEKGQDGYIFHTIRNGVANTPGAQPALRMPAYAERISEKDAWAIVAYFRALQNARQGELEEVPESQRQRLLSSGPAGGSSPASSEESSL